MRKLIVAFGLFLIGSSSSAQAQFCPGVTPWVFDDVPDTDPMCAYITEMAVRGVTVGCQVIDPNHRLYCPTQSVRRDQMAAFMSRLAGSLFPATITGNLTLPESTSASVGNIMKGSIPFIHDYGVQNTFIGENAGNFTMTGGANTASGWRALSSNTTGPFNTASGQNALFSNSTGYYNTAGGASALNYNTTGSFNTASGSYALYSNTEGLGNTASGINALGSNTTGVNNTASGNNALHSNTTGNYNTGLGHYADVASGDLTNATAIGYNAIVNASNKIRLGNTNVTVIEGQVAYTYTSDRNQKENFRLVEGEGALSRLRGLSVTSWNYIGQEAGQFRHYGPMAQDFYEAFGDDGVGSIGTPTTINSGDLEGVMLVATQALEKRTAALNARIGELELAAIQYKTQLAELMERAQKAEALAADVVMLKATLAELQCTRSIVASE